MLVRRAIEERGRGLAAHLVMFALLVTTACSHGGSGSSATSRSFDEVDVHRDLVYDDARGLRLDLYEPRGDTANARPALVWVHGGGFAEGDKADGPLIEFPTEFARSGYVAVSIDYRLLASEQCIEPRLESADCDNAARAATVDAQDAIRWVRAHAVTYRVDPDRIAIAGESAGAITAARVGTGADGDADRVRAWVAFSGAVRAGEGVDAGDAAGCLVTNTQDPWIPFAWSADTAAAMRAAGVPVVLKTIEGPGHVQADHAEMFLLEAKTFLHEHLDLDGHPS